MKIEIKIRADKSDVRDMLDANDNDMFHVTAASKIFNCEVWDVYEIDSDTVEITLGAHAEIGP